MLRLRRAPCVFFFFSRLDAGRVQVKKTKNTPGKRRKLSLEQRESPTHARTHTHTNTHTRARTHTPVCVRILRSARALARSLFPLTQTTGPAGSEPKSVQSRAPPGGERAHAPPPAPLFFLLLPLPSYPAPAPAPCSTHLPLRLPVTVLTMFLLHGRLPLQSKLQSPHALPLPRTPIQQAARGAPRPLSSKQRKALCADTEQDETEESGIGTRAVCSTSAMQGEQATTGQSNTEVERRPPPARPAASSPSQTRAMLSA